MNSKDVANFNSRGEESSRRLAAAPAEVGIASPATYAYHAFVGNACQGRRAKASRSQPDRSTSDTSTSISQWS